MQGSPLIMLYMGSIEMVFVSSEVNHVIMGQFYKGTYRKLLFGGQYMTVLYLELFYNE